MRLDDDFDGFSGPGDQVEARLEASRPGGRRSLPSQQVYANADQCEEDNSQSSLNNRSNQEFHPTGNLEEVRQNEAADEGAAY